MSLCSGSARGQLNDSSQFTYHRRRRWGERGGQGEEEERETGEGEEAKGVDTSQSTKLHAEMQTQPTGRQTGKETKEMDEERGE